MTREEYKDATMAMALRQGGACALCGRAFGTHLMPTFGHSRSRSMGGGTRDDRIEIDGKWNNCAMCVPCQAVQGSSRYYWNEQGEYVKWRKG